MEDENDAVVLDLPEDAVQVRSADKRELDIRLWAWDHPIETPDGLEQITRGALDGIDPRSVYLMEREHGAHLALGMSGQPTLKRNTAGRGTAITDDGVGPVLTVKVGRTQAGDEILSLYEDGIVTGASAEFFPVKTRSERHGGRRLRIHEKLNLTGVSTTHRPAAGEPAAVIAMRSKDEEKTVSEETPQPQPIDQEANRAVLDAISALAAKQEDQGRYLAKIEELEIQVRSGFAVPAAETTETELPQIGAWVKAVAGLMLGERLPAQEMRTIDDVITTDNPGVVPEAFLGDVRGVIDARRPFMESTRQLRMPAAGMKLNVPIINQRPEVGVQSTEKSEVASRKTLIGVGDFDLVTIAGAGDLSLQIIRRSSPEFLGLWIELLGEQYAIVSEDQALRALFNATGGVGAGNALNPASLNLGGAFQTSFDAIRRPPDTLWLSTEAVAEFIDAKASTTNQPLYSTITTSATAAGGITGTISGLRVVHVPGLDAHGAYAIVGPSSGFAWAEEGPLTLQADVPTLAGRDVALVGMAFFVPWYPDAFSLYNVAS